MRIDAWQAPLLVMAGIIVLEFVIGSVLRRQKVPTRWGVAQTVAALLVLAVLVVGVAVIALGPSLADQLSSVTAAVATVVALYLTYRSYRTDPPARATPADPPGGDPTRAGDSSAEPDEVSRTR